MKFGKLEDDDRFLYGGEKFEKDALPEGLDIVLENAINLEDDTGAYFEDDTEVTPLTSDLEL